MSLMEQRQMGGRHINPIFTSKEGWIWTADQVQGKLPGTYFIDFDDGSYKWSDLRINDYIRVVRSA